MANEQKINDLDAAIKGNPEFKKDWHHETPADELLNILTAVYPNGNLVKKFDISTGQNVLVRELSGRDMMDIQKILTADQSAGDVQEKYMSAMLHAAVKINGKQLPMEDFEKLKGKDYSRIQLAVQSLNF